MQFYTLLASQRRVETLREPRKIAQQSEATSIKLLRGQQGTETDVLLLRIELRCIEASLRSAEFATAAASQQLSALLGLPNYKIEQVTGDLLLPLPDFDDPQVRAALAVELHWWPAPGWRSRGRSFSCGARRLSQFRT